MAELKWPKSFAYASALPDDQVSQLIEALIAVLDLREGDVDLEATGAEDDFMVHPNAGPGCPVGDPDFCPIERSGELTSHESIYQGVASAPHEHDDDEPDGLALRAPHRDRVRREQCSPKWPDGYSLNREVRI